MSLYSRYSAPSFEVQHAINDARSAQLQAESIRLGQPPEPIDPDAGAKAEIAHLARMGGEAASVAFALVYASGLPVVAIDRDLLVPSSGPMSTVQQVADHWRTHLTDGVGVPAGTLPSGTTLVALRGTPLALKAWLLEHATETVRKVDDERVVDERLTYRAVGDYSTVRWHPPAPRTGIRTTTFGAAALMRATDELLHGATREAGERMSWLVWAVGAVWAVPPILDDTAPAATSRRRLAVKSRKLSHGVELVGEGEVIPQYVQRPDGWRLDATRIPTASLPLEVPDWLVVDAFGGRWVDEALVDGTWKPAPRVRAA